jgi:hypothetical protein
MHFSDTILLALPFIGLMAMCVFGLDERLASPKTVIPRRKKFCELVGQVTFSDPDGRPLIVTITR